MLSKVILFSLIVSWVSVADACFCMPMDVEQNICSSDLVAVVQVNGHTSVPSASPGADGLNRYDVQVVEKWRSNSGVPETITSIESRNNFARCGVTLVVGKEYLVTGPVTSEGRLSINLCNSIRRYTETMEVEERKHLQSVADGCAVSI